MKSVWPRLALGACLLLSACASAPPAAAPTATGEYLAGRLAARVNAVDDAARAFATAAEKAPNEPSVQRGAFFYFAASGDIDAAVPYAERLIATPSDDARMDGIAGLLLAAHDLKAGRLAEARGRLSKPLEAPFVDSLAFLVDVWIEDGLHGPKAAIEKLDKPRDGVFAGFSPLHRGLLADKLGHAAEARAGLEASVFGLGGPIGREAYGAFLERSGDVKSARAFYGVVARAPGPGRRLAEAAEIRLAAVKPSMAYADVQPAEGAAIALYTFAAAMTQQINDERERATTAGFNLGDPQYDAPLVLSQLALYLDPGLDDARRLIADVYNIYDNHDAAQRTLAPISPRSPNFESARAEMAAALAAQKKDKEAVALLEDAIRADPLSRELRWTLAGVHADEGRREEAVGELTRVIDALPAKPTEDAWRFYVARAESLLGLGRWPDAEKDLKRAVEIAPEEPTALNYLGYSWVERGINLDAAFALIEKAVAAEPRSGAYVDSLGWAHYQRGAYAEAVKHLEEAAVLEPSDPTITEHLGDVYWRLGRAVEAQYQWKRALDLEPTPAQRSSIETKLKSGLPGAATKTP